MTDIENIVRPGTVTAASTLAELSDEEFVLAITSAYMAGKAKGSRDAQNAA